MKENDIKKLRNVAIKLYADHTIRSSSAGVTITSEPDLEGSTVVTFKNLHKAWDGIIKKKLAALELYTTDSIASIVQKLSEKGWHGVIVNHRCSLFSYGLHLSLTNEPVRAWKK